MVKLASEPVDTVEKRQGLSSEEAEKSHTAHQVQGHVYVFFFFEKKKNRSRKQMRQKRSTVGRVLNCSTMSSKPRARLESDLTGAGHLSVKASTLRRGAAKEVKTRLTRPLTNSSLSKTVPHSEWTILPKHTRKGLMLRLLRDANAPLEMLTAARHFHVTTVIWWLDGQEQSDLSKCLVARNLATPFQLMRVTGNRDGREAIIVNIINEASRFHVALVRKKIEPSELGNLTAMDFLQGRQLSSAWTRKVRSNLTSFECGVPLEVLKFK